MKASILSSGIACLVFIGIHLPASSQAQPIRTQRITLEKGWNAIWLEVTPSEAEPGKVFADLPVDIAARYFRLATSVQFIDDPVDEPWKREGWGVWYAPQRPDAVLSDLGAIQGNHGYLIHATESFVWNLEGEVQFKRLRWRSDSYNLVGFTVDPSSPPFFQRFFAGTNGKIGRKVYRLINGHWQPVDPATTPMRPGEAAWILCEGQTDFQGPLDVTIPGARLLDFGDGLDDLEVSYRNADPSPQTISFDLLPGENSLPLNRVVVDLSRARTSYPEFAGGVAPKPLPRKGTDRFRLQIRRDRMTQDHQSAILRLSSDIGHQVFIPVAARKAAATP